MKKLNFSKSLIINDGQFDQNLYKEFIDNQYNFINITFYINGEMKYNYYFNSGYIHTCRINSKSLYFEYNDINACNILSKSEYELLNYVIKHNDLLKFMVIV